MNKQIGVFMAVLVSAGLVAGTGFAATGIATMMGTAPDSKIGGTVTLTDTPAGLKVSAQLINVPEGKHGFHIHEFGACGDAGKAAGGHFNPAGMPHGMVMKDGVEHVHAGDMGNITADKNGMAMLDVVIPGVTLAGGKFAVANHAIILHEKVDDFGQPTGNAGGRIGCGVIQLSK